MSNCVVYEHWRLDRDECFYVGVAKHKSRPYDMKKRNPHHKAIVAKAFREGFAVEVRIVCSGLTWEEACKIEIERISFWRNAGVDLTNITAGGDGCIIFGAKNHQFGKPSYFRGKKHSEKARAEISKKMVGNKNQTNRVYATGEKHSFFGRKHSPETIFKMKQYHILKKTRKLADQTDRADAVQIDQLTLAQEV